ncbi:DUF1636 family protein [Pelagibius sp.]|uniref:DUF1636 family protein n=1 Tax=Pelagibius sp. TaxID=1931238 RepID=UPI003BB0C15F
MTTPSEPADRSHRIVVCTTCRHPKTGENSGDDLIGSLRTAVGTAAGDGVSQSFSVIGIACMAGCDRPATVAFQGDGKATYLFGDIEPSDTEALVAFARLYKTSANGWTRCDERPAALATKTLARVPALNSLTSIDGEIAP